MVLKRSAECVVRANAQIAESPLWDSRVGMLLWADIARGELWRSDVSSGESELHSLHSPLGSIAPLASQGYLLAGGETISAVDAFGERPYPLARAFDDRRLKLNDGALDSNGRFWVGSVAISGARGLGNLYCLDNRQTLHPILSDVTISNGMDWSPDNRCFYYVDSSTGGVDTFDYVADEPTLLNRRRFIDLPTELGLCDGLAVDTDGCIWLAVWFLGEIRRYSPDGRLIEIVCVPATLTTSCTFGGNDMRTLFITTAKGLPKDGRQTGELAGSIFAIETSTRGQSRPAFVGTN